MLPPPQLPVHHSLELSIAITCTAPNYCTLNAISVGYISLLSIAYRHASSGY
jgi:hypothetical protein